ncbi:hypothetical protein VTN02DRAFT_609 [Thermoascus thermophilus]
MMNEWNTRYFLGVVGTSAFVAAPDLRLRRGCAARRATPDWLGNRIMESPPSRLHLYISPPSTSLSAIRIVCFAGSSHGSPSFSSSSGQLRRPLLVLLGSGTDFVKVASKSHVRPPAWGVIPPETSHQDVLGHQELLRERHDGLQGQRRPGAGSAAS